MTEPATEGEQCPTARELIPSTIRYVNAYTLDTPDAEASQLGEPKHTLAEAVKSGLTTHDTKGFTTLRLVFRGPLVTKAEVVSQRVRRANGTWSVTTTNEKDEK